MRVFPPSWAAGSTPQRPARALFFSTFAAYIGVVPVSPAMEIKCRRNKPFGPGGQHPAPPPKPAACSVGFGGGRNRIDEGVKDVFFPGMVSAVIGLCNSCKRQLCLRWLRQRVSGLKNQV